MRIFIILSGILLSQTNVTAQQKWNLKSVVDYAMANNISVKLTDVQAKVAELTYKQSKLSQYPNLNFSANTGLNSGSNQDPTTFSRITQTYLSAGLQLQSSADIFNFYSKRNSILANQWEFEAAKANVDKVKNDIALTAANAYLQVLLSMEQQKIAEVQIQQTAAQLVNTDKQVKAGALPELNLTQLEAQLAQDSVNYYTSIGNVTQNILTLKMYMNIDAAAQFEVEAPPVESIPVDPIADLLPNIVYDMALQNQPLQKYNALRLKAAERFTAAAKGQMYPTFSLYGSLGSNYNNQSRTIKGVNQVVGPDIPIGTVDVGGTTYTVKAPTVNSIPIYQKSNFPHQLSDNFRQGVGISVSVPIFSGGSLKTNYQKSKLNQISLGYQKEQDDQKLKQDIYSAYNAALMAMQKFNASKKSVESNEKTFNFAQKRFDVGMLNTFDLITAQNNLFRSKLEYTLNQFDFVFKMKVLEFYKGLGLKL